MMLNGKEYGFMLTVAASQEVATICRDQSLRNLTEALWDADLPRANENKIRFICAMSAGYEEAQAMENPTHEPQPITPAELHRVTLGELFRLTNEATEAFVRDINPSVEVEEVKKNGVAVE